MLTRNDNSDPWGAYPGVRMDAHFIAHPKQINPDLSGNPTVVWILAAVDFPFSTAADTLLLPFDLTMHMPNSGKPTNQPLNTARGPVGDGAGSSNSQSTPLPAGGSASGR